MAKKRASSESDNDCADAWLALAESADFGVSESIRRTIYREAGRDPVRVLRWLSSALLLRDLLAIEADVGFFCIAFATECIAETRLDKDPELRRIELAIAAVAKSKGVDVEEYDMVANQPPEVLELNQKWNARMDAIEVDVLVEAGALEEAEFRRQGFPFEERREAGRWALFGELEPSMDDDADDEEPRDPFLA